MSSPFVGNYLEGDVVIVSEEIRIAETGNLRLHAVAPRDCWFTAERDIDGDGTIDVLAEARGAGAAGSSSSSLKSSSQGPVILPPLSAASPHQSKKKASPWLID
jgi:hypothetical protein